jgi:phosphoglycerol transferase MdoB-like AlkP superfamily enzyme
MRRLTLRFWLVGLALLTLARLALCIWQWPRIAAVDGIWPVLLGGLRMDAVMLGMLSVPIAVLSPWFGHMARAQRLTAWWYRLCWFFLVLMEVSTPQFLVEYDTRPNRLYFEYLVHPKEVAAMLWHGYAGILFAAFVVLALATWAGMRIFRAGRADRRLPLWQRPALMLVMLATMVLAIRGTLEHRPINASTVAFSSDAMVNALPLNSLYSVTHAMYRLKDERSASALYEDMPDEQLLRIVRDAAHIEGPVENAAIPTLDEQHASVRRDKPANLVIIVEESLGAQYVGSLGGRNLTPELDALAAQAWNFRQAYATGTRSVRGLEALVTGFPPTPSEAVLKLSGAQTGFFTLAELLGRHGYHSRFIYGGEAHFDNMRGFFLGNGFDEVIDRAAFVDPAFVGSWGASDEDMFTQLDKVLSEGTDRPTLTVAFSVSNHSPWEYPQGRIQPEGEPASVENTVRYADWALGQFFRKARQSAYWDDTVFLVVADHDARVGGAALVPVRNFHIPALIVGKGIAPRQDERVVSQIDLPPTLLSLIGVDTQHPMPGHDLTLPHAGGRAMMQYGDNYGYLEGDRLVILEPHKPATQYIYQAPDRLEAEPVAPELEQEALAMALWPEMAYRRKQYALPDHAVGEP